MRFRSAAVIGLFNGVPEVEGKMTEFGSVGTSSVSESESMHFFDDGLEAWLHDLSELFGMFEEPEIFLFLFGRENLEEIGNEGSVEGVVDGIMNGEDFDLCRFDNERDFLLLHCAFKAGIS